MGFPDEIRSIRRKSLMSQKEFAHELGVSFATVNRWETGKTRPKYRAVKALQEFCKYKGINCSDCINDWEESNN